MRCMYSILLYLLLAALGNCYISGTVTSTMLVQHELVAHQTHSLNVCLNLQSRYRFTRAQNRGSPFWIDRGFTEGVQHQPLIPRPFKPHLVQHHRGEIRVGFSFTSSLVHIRDTLAAAMVVSGGGVTGPGV
jgi:hypothetical protein